jgi:hypothetical protein
MSLLSRPVSRSDGTLPDPIGRVRFANICEGNHSVVLALTPLKGSVIELIIDDRIV